MKNKHSGSSFDSWLEEQGIAVEVLQEARRRVRAECRILERILERFLIASLTAFLCSFVLYHSLPNSPLLFALRTVLVVCLLVIGLCGADWEDWKTLYENNTDSLDE